MYWPTAHRIIFHCDFFYRSLQTRAALQSSSLQSFHYRNYRLHGHSHPAVVSGAQNSLSLTPSRTGFLPIETRRKSSPMSRRNYESAHHPSSLPYMAPVATFVTSADVTGSSPIASPTPPTLRSLPVTKPKIHRQRLTHKHCLSSKSRLVIRYKPPTPPLSVNKSPSPPTSARPDFDRRSETIKSYRAQLQSYFAPRRGDVSLVGHKMAPVLRVLPASNRSEEKRAESARKASEKRSDETEVTSQKRVHFSDQLGFPLVRNMTPNYRRKHSYILRWLETAGRTSQVLSS